MLLTKLADALHDQQLGMARHFITVYRQWSWYKWPQTPHEFAKRNLIDAVDRVLRKRLSPIKLGDQHQRLPELLSEREQRIRPAQPLQPLQQVQGPERLPFGRDTNEAWFALLQAVKHAERRDDRLQDYLIQRFEQEKAVKQYVPKSHEEGQLVNQLMKWSNTKFAVWDPDSDQAPPGFATNHSAVQRVTLWQALRKTADPSHIRAAFFQSPTEFVSGLLVLVRFIQTLFCFKHLYGAATALASAAWASATLGTVVSTTFWTTATLVGTGTLGPAMIPIVLGLQNATFGVGLGFLAVVLLTVVLVKNGYLEAWGLGWVANVFNTIFEWLITLRNWAALIKSIISVSGDNCEAVITDLVRWGRVMFFRNIVALVPNNNTPGSLMSVSGLMNVALKLLAVLHMPSVERADLEWLEKGGASPGVVDSLVSALNLETLVFKTDQPT